MLNRLRGLGAVVLLLMLAACDHAEPESAGRLDVVTALTVALNPTGVAPLAAVVTVTTTQPTSVEVTVAGPRASR